MIDAQLWSLGPEPQLVSPTAFDRASDLIAILVRCPDILSSEWMIIGKQEDMGSGRCADLVAIDQAGVLQLIEVCNLTPSRDAMVTLLARADWLAELSEQDLHAMYDRFSSGNLDRDFCDRFSSERPQTKVDQSGALVLLTADHDARVDGAAAYLRSRGVEITLIRYTLFEQTGAPPLLTVHRSG